MDNEVFLGYCDLVHCRIVTYLIIFSAFRTFRSRAAFICFHDLDFALAELPVTGYHFFAYVHGIYTNNVSRFVAAYLISFLCLVLAAPLHPGKVSSGSGTSGSGRTDALVSPCFTVFSLDLRCHRRARDASYRDQTCQQQTSAIPACHRHNLLQPACYASTLHRLECGASKAFQV
jgi:hypothetical protein